MSEHLDAIMAHAEACQPLECCGLIVNQAGIELYLPCKNLSIEPGHFVLDPVDFAAAEDAGTVVQVVHSHVYQSADPTDADRVGCEASGLPWLIAAWPTGNWSEIEPTGYQADLIGREFVWGVFDCFTLIRDYYRQTLGILISDGGGYPFRDSGLYQARFESAGFAQVDGDPRPHDVILMGIAGASEANHAAIYVGNETILHHVQNRLSGRVPYGGYWRDTTRAVLRHQSLC